MMTAEDVRRLALSLPEVEERPTWGEATFRVRNKIFVLLSANGQQAGVKASPEDQDALIRMDPETFAVAHYTGRFGWVTVQLASVDPTDMRQLVTEAWRRTAPKGLTRSP